MADPLLRSQPAWGKTLANVLFPGFVLLIALGYGVLYSGRGNLAGSELSSDRALFQAVNAATGSGFDMNVGLGQMNALGLSVVMLLMTAGTLAGFVIGGLAVTRILQLDFSDRAVIVASLIACGLAYVVGGVGGAMAGQSAFDALFLAVSAFGNVGLIAGATPAVTEPLVQLLILPLAVLGGLGITVLMELTAAATRRKALSAHARTVLVGSAVLYLAGFVLLLAVRFPSPGATTAEWRQTLASCSTLSINARTLGMPLEWATNLARPVQWLLMLLMLIGAGSAGSAGGLKIITLAELFQGTRRLLSGQTVGRTFGVAVVWLGTYLGLAIVAQLLLLHHASDLPADRALFLTISALGNVGLSHDALSLTGPPLYTLSATMFAGKIAPLLILWWQADRPDSAQRAIG